MQSFSHAMSANQGIAIVDINATGTRALHDRIIEIALILIDADGIREWSSLVNPGLSIPSFMTQLTGISNDAVVLAPSFAELAPTVIEMLRGRLFIAHHARIDYSLLKAECARTGERFQTRNLCTVRLSRALNPTQTGHSLDAVLRHYNIAPMSRQRALDMASAIYQFLQHAERRHGVDAMRSAIAQLNKRPTLPAYLDESLADELPECPGVYFFHGEHSMLYVGKAKNIRSRVLSHFSADLKNPKEMRLSQQVRRISWEVTAGELGALLREARYVKKLQPLHNRQLRRKSQLVSISLSTNDNGVLMPRAVSGQHLRHGLRLYGLFNSVAAVSKHLRELGSRHGFCDYALGLERQACRPCPSRQLRRCHGLCDGSESATRHNQRLTEALAEHALKVWPFAGMIALEEHNPINDVREFYVIDQWCWLGSATSLKAAQQLAHKPDDLVLDKDSYRLLVNALLGKSTLNIHPLDTPA